MSADGNLTIKVFNKIEQIPSREWSKVFPQTLESYYFYKTIDESNFSRFAFYYIAAYRENELIGVAPCFSMVYPLDTTVSGPAKKILNLLKKVFPDFLDLKTIMCGCPATEGSIGIIGTDKQTIFEAMYQEIKKLAESQKAFGIAFKDFPRIYSQIFKPLISEGFCRLRGYPSVAIDLNFRNFDEYLKTLSRSSRKSLKRKFRKLDKLEKITLKVTNHLDGELEEAYRLYSQVFSKSEIHFEEYTKEFLQKIAQNMPEETKYFLWYIKGKLVAFNLCLASKDILIDEFIGLDYSVAYEYGLYFVTFRDIITWCLENGIKRYESGAMAYETKRRLGHTFLPLDLYVKVISQHFKRFGFLLCRLLKPENFDEELREVYRRLADAKS